MIKVLLHSVCTRSSATAMASDGKKKHSKVTDPGSEYGCNFPEVINLLS
jgi:hypothetical protein